MKKQPIKILHVIHHLRIGGAERVLVTLLQELLSYERFSLSVAVLNGGGALEMDLNNCKIPLYDLQKGKGFDLSFISRLFLLLKNHHFDILHMHSFSAAMWGRLFSIGSGIKIRIITDHDIAGWINPKKHIIVNRALEPLTDRIVTVSEAARQALVMREGIKNEKIDVISNGINLQKFLNVPSVEECRAKYFLKSNLPIVGMVARSSYEKGADLLIEAIATLRKDGLHVMGVIAGDGPLLETLKNQAIQLGVEDCIHFPGAVEPENVAEILNCFDIGVCPSRQESFGLAAIEIMAVGKPIVATNVGGLPEIITHGKTGLLVERENSEQISINVKKLIEDPDYKMSIGLRAKEYVKNTFTSKIMAQRYADLYNVLYERHLR